MSDVIVSLTKGRDRTGRGNEVGSVYDIAGVVG